MKSSCCNISSELRVLLFVFNCRNYTDCDIVPMVHFKTIDMLLNLLELILLTKRHGLVVLVNSMPLLSMT